MADCTRFVGLDYHQKQIQLCMLDGDGQVLMNKRCPNDWRALAAAVPADQPIQAAIEASPGAADLADQLSEQGGWSVSLAHARYVARLKQNPDKTDLSDAQLLADLTRVGYLPRTWRAPQYIRDLRELVQYRQQMANRRRSIKQRVQAVRREHRIKGAPAGAWTQTWIYWLRHHERLSETSRWLIEEHLEELDWVQGRIDRVEAKLDEFTENDPVVQRLRRLPGIGAVTAWALRASVGRFDRFRSAKALARYCGLSPKNDSSGDHQRQRGLIADADRQLRALLIQAGHRLLRRSDRWGQLGQHLLAQGKAKSVAVAAVTNRWLRWIYHRMLEPEA